MLCCKRQFRLRWRAPERLPISDRDLVRPRPGLVPLRRRPGILQDERMVQKVERLGRDDADVALAGDDAGVSEVEEFENLRDRVAEGGDVNTATNRFVGVTEIGGGAGLYSWAAGGEVETAAD